MWIVWYEKGNERESEDWYVPNRVAEGTIERLRKLGQEMATTDQYRKWVKRFQDESRGIWYVNGFNIADAFDSAAEVDFWSEVAHELARRCYERKVGIHATQDSVELIWAAFDLQRVLSIAARSMRMLEYPNTAVIAENKS